MQQLPVAAPEGQPAAQARDGDAAAMTEAALRAELAKWQERVPKLAAALRQRTAEVEALRKELETRAAQTGSPGARAREELLRELEGRHADLKERYRSAQAELHKRQLDTDELRTEAEDWKAKWQAVTRTLDEQSQAAAGHDERVAALEAERDEARRDLAEAVEQHLERKRALQQAESEAESLRARNEQLFETTEMANRQIEALSDSIAELREAREQAEAQAAAAAAELAEAHQARAAAESAAAQARSDAADELAGLRAADAEQRQELDRLRDVVSAAQRTVSERDQERRAMSEQMQALEARARHLEQQLAERSELVVTLERDQTQDRETIERLREAHEELEAARLRAERHARENADHIAQLDAKLERQQQLMVDLEAELADANRALADAQRPAPPQPAGDDAEVARLQAQVRKLEQTVRERTEALNHAQWQRRLAGETAARERGEVDPADVADGRLLAVLNQQLADARAQNGELLDRIRALEAERSSNRPGERADELTLIHGIGQKLAEQLHALGIHRLGQIAALDPSDLDDADHLLHPHRARILRDRWIEQAARLAQS